MRGIWRRETAHQWCRLSYLLNCVALKASDTCPHNTINVMHDIIYPMPHMSKFIYSTWNKMKMHVQPVPMWIKGHKLISNFSGYIQHYCPATSETPKNNLKKSVFIMQVVQTHSNEEGKASEKLSWNKLNGNQTAAFYNNVLNPHQTVQFNLMLRFDRILNLFRKLCFQNIWLFTQYVGIERISTMCHQFRTTAQTFHSVLFPFSHGAPSPNWSTTSPFLHLFLYLFLPLVKLYFNPTKIFICPATTEHFPHFITLPLLFLWLYLSILPPKDVRFFNE